MCGEQQAHGGAHTAQPLGLQQPGKVSRIPEQVLLARELVISKDHCACQDMHFHNDKSQRREA